MRICALLAGRSMAELCGQASEARRQGADLAEIRIDRVNDPENIEAIESFPLPVIVSCVFTKNQDILALVKKALKFRVEFIDLDLAFPKKSLEDIFSFARSNGVGTIVSYYPDKFVAEKTLKKVVEDMAVLSKHIKIRLPAKNKKDASFTGINNVSVKVGAKLSLLNTLENPYSAPEERKNFLGYAKLAGDQENNNLATIETVKKLIIESVKSV